MVPILPIIKWDDVYCVDIKMILSLFCRYNNVNVSFLMILKWNDVFFYVDIKMIQFLNDKIKMVENENFWHCSAILLLLESFSDTASKEVQYSRGNERN